jgi:hypothetical protein
LRPSLVTTLVLLPSALLGQARDVALHVGRWWAGGPADAYELRVGGLAATALVHDSLGRNRAFYGLGYEVHAFRGRRALGSYALAGLGLGLSTAPTTQELGALWSVGAGLEWRPIQSFAFSAEARYRVEDRGPRGFWRLRSDARKGFGVTLGLAIRLGRGGGRPVARPAPEPPATISGTAAPVVRTALDALGRPYQWGGTADNGFDCSGLIQWAYARHGVSLPRMSRDQAGSGSEVPPVVEALQPGDILLFAARPGGGVTHVGLYVGERKFIHSANTGVRLSMLERSDPEADWWLARWVGARRVIP